MTPVSGRVPFEQHRERGTFARVTGNSAVFRLRSSRIGRNDRANERANEQTRANERVSGRTSENGLAAVENVRVYACVYLDRTKRISFLAFMAPASSFPAFDTPFRVARGRARPEKIYRRRATDGPRDCRPESATTRSRTHARDLRYREKYREE